MIVAPAVPPTIEPMMRATVTPRLAETMRPIIASEREKFLWERWELHKNRALAKHP